MADEITDEQIAELRRLHEAATPGPWRVAHHTPRGGFERVHVGTEHESGRVIVTRRGSAEDDLNFALVVAARNALPALLSRLERAEKAVKESYLRGKTDGANEEHSLNWRRENERIEALEKERDEANARVNAAFRSDGHTHEAHTALAELRTARASVATLEAALRECEDYFDQRADADCVGDPPAYAGNREMTLLGIVRRALRGLEGK